MAEPRVLVVSHNVFSSSGNMGKTMMHMLAGISPDHLAQLYFHQEIPTRRCCLHYFRMTDSNILHSLFTRKAKFRIFDASDIDESAAQSRTDTGQLAKIYQFSRRRTPLIYFLRDTMWRCSKWKSKELLEWARAFAPDVIFLAAGDYAFPYRVAIWLSDILHIPIVMWCADDFYIEPLHHGPFLRRIQCRRLVKLARKVIQRGGTVVTISDMMQRDYARLFQVPTKTVRISSAINRCSLPAESRSGVVYVGNLGINRIVPLAELGRALKAAAIPGFETIQVYSGERNPSILQQINGENGLTYCGCVSEREVERLLGTSRFVIFVEAFDAQSICRTKYSLSTKIAESMRSGACILAYGPSEIASIDYLRQHHAACMLEHAEELPGAVRRLCEEANEYSQYTQCARSLAERFHSAEVNEACLKEILTEAIRKDQAMENRKGSKVAGKPDMIRPRHGDAGMTCRKWMSMLLSVIFMCGLLAGCSSAQKETDDHRSAETALEDIVIHTDYGDLHYPACWQEYVTIHQEQNGSTIVVTFETESGEETVELFRVSIGDDSGNVIGSLTDDTGTQRYVCLHVEELPANASPEEAEQTRFYAMQEDLNYLVDYLK